jgi:hypothetical protein
MLDSVFYNDLLKPTYVRQHKKARQRKSKAETQQHYEKKLEKWKASLQLDIELRLKWNSITQEFYTQCVTLVHIDRIEAMQDHYKRIIHLQEDNDPRHRTKTTSNVAARFKRERNIWILQHYV